jgi:hypothetical protein
VIETLCLLCLFFLKIHISHCQTIHNYRYVCSIVDEDISLQLHVYMYGNCIRTYVLTHHIPYTVPHIWIIVVDRQSELNYSNVAMHHQHLLNLPCNLAHDLRSSVQLPDDHSIATHRIFDVVVLHTMTISKL